MLYNALITSHIDDNTSIVLTDMTKQYTYTQIDQICHRVGCQLKRYGVKPLDRVIIRADRTLDTVLIILSCIRLGVCFIPVSPAVSEEMLLDIIKDSSPVLVVGSFEQDAIMQCLPVALLQDISDEEESPNSELEEDTIVYILYTSGSTGIPKGVVAPMKNVEFCVYAINERIKNTANDKILCCLPLSFDYGLYQIFLALSAGACLVVAPEVPLPQIVSFLAKEEITGFPAMPAMLNMLIKTRLLNKVHLSALRYITSTGDTFPISLIHQIREAIPSAVVVPMYGLTECKRVTVMPLDRLDKTLAGSCGLPLTGTEVWVEAPDTEGIGELIVCGQNVMAGYWNDNNTTSMYYFINEQGKRCLRTGDYFRIDSEGFLYFVGRKKEILKVNGYRIGVSELENRLLSEANDLINEIGIFGYPDEIMGERIAVCISTDYPAQIIVEWLTKTSEKLSSYQRPHFLYCTALPLPKNINGKIDRRKLKETRQLHDFIKLR